MNNKITLVIPTHGREQYLKRSLDYWSKIKIKILVADSSFEKFRSFIPDVVNYFHYPGVPFNNKLFDVLKKVKTKYSVLCADDDFITKAGLFKSIDYLENHDEYVSAQGRYVTFWFNDKSSIDYLPRYEIYRNYEIKHRVAKERMKLSMSPYMHQFYAVHKTDILKEALSVCTKHYHTRGWEYNVSLVASMYGNHKLLPVFYCAREALDESNRKYPHVISPVIEDWYADPSNKEELNKWRNAIAEVYAKHEEANINEGKEIFDIIMSNIFQPLHSTDSSITIKETIKRYVPQVMISPLRKIIKRLWGKGKWPPNSKHAKKMRQEISKEKGYPWSDEEANKEWKIIKKIIKKHGPLDGATFKDHLT